MKNIAKVIKWFEKYDDFNYKPELKFEDLEVKYHPIKQVSAIIFLASKLKDKNQESILGAEHHTLYIGGSFDELEEFSEDDVKIAVAHGIMVADDGDGFMIYASL